MLTEEQIQSNKERFISLLSSIEIDGADVNGLINYLTDSDFFIAPATSIAHGNYEGGLCYHSLRVYETLLKLVEQFKDETTPIDNTSIIILGLLHDISKVNYYEKYTRNVKNESSGRWEQVEGYRIIDVKDRDTFGDRAFNSYLSISKFIPLTNSEIAAIINFNCGMDNKYSNGDLHGILEKFNSAVFLHCADMLVSYTLKDE